MVREYDNIYHTGNEALDVVLTEKARECQRENIQFTCIADGKYVNEMTEMDIYSLFGNLLDNAIEGVKKNAHTDERIISLIITKNGNVVCIHIENYFCDNLQFCNGFPMTTKADKELHGFGLKRISRIVDEYKGTLSLSAEENIFTVNILIPQRKNSI